MRCRRTLFLGVFILIAFAICSVRGDGAAADESTQTIKGKIVSYDAERNLLRLAKGSQTITFVVDKNAKVIVDGDPNALKLVDVAEATPLNLVLNADGTTILEIRPIGPNKSGGIVVSIDVEKRTLNLRKGKKTATYTFIENATVTEDKDEASLEAVRPGLVTTLQLTFDKTQVAVINLRTPKKK